MRDSAIVEAITFKENFIAWGTQVRGRRGLVGSTLAKRHQIGVLVFEFLCLRRSDVSCLDRVLGSLVHPFCHKPELASVFHRIHKWKTKLVEGEVYKVPGDIRDELGIRDLVLGLAETNVRAPCESKLRCTDATPSAFGACEAPCPPRVCRGLFRLGRHRGEYVRTDWGELGAPWLPSRMPKVDAETNQLFRQLPWKTTLSSRFGRQSHINLQEAHALKYEVKRVICEDPGACRQPRRIVVGVDSRVLAGAGMKGRSSSYRLNGILRTLTSLCISFRITLALPWIDTKSNAADHPSRFVAVPPPEPMTPNIARILGYPAAIPSLPAAPATTPPLPSTSRRSLPVVPFTVSGSGCRFPSVTELHRRVELALGSRGERMQRNIVAQQLTRMCDIPDDMSEFDFERTGGFRECFAGAGGISKELRKRGEHDVVAMEAFPGSADDSGLKPWCLHCGI